MHELAVCTAIAKIADRAAGERPVTVVRVDIGYLRQVVPDTLVYSWEMVVFGTPLEGAALEVRAVPAVIRCTVCDDTTELDDPVLRCAACGSFDTEVISGDEMLVTSVDVTVEDAVDVTVDDAVDDAVDEAVDEAVDDV